MVVVSNIEDVEERELLLRVSPVERNRWSLVGVEGSAASNRKKETTARIKQHAAARTRADCNQQPQQTHTIKKIFFHAPDEF